MLSATLDGIPQSLRPHKQWVNWRIEPRNGKPSKVPKTPWRKNAESDNPDTWTTFDKAWGAYTCNNTGPYFLGVGFMFAPDDPYCGIDLDACRNPFTGELAPWAAEIVERFNTYTEVSPSGTGVKLFCIGKNPFDTGRKVIVPGYPKMGDKSPEIELYDNRRYFTLTGHRVGDVADPVDCTDALAWLAEKMKTIKNKPPKPPKAKPEKTPTVAVATPTDSAADAGPCMEIREVWCWKAIRNDIRKNGESIDGSDGSGRFLHVACLTYEFALDDETRLRVIAKYNRDHCTPAWSDAEIQHKIESAKAKATWGSRLKKSGESTDVNERIADPTRLARMFVAGLQDDHTPTTFFQGEHWRHNGAAYRLTSLDDLKGELWEFVKEDFDDENRKAIAAHAANDSDKPPPKAEVVTKALIENCIGAASSLTRLPPGTESPCWLGKPPVAWRPLDVLPMRNGLVNLARFIAGESEYRIDPTPQFFSTAGLDYDWTDHESGVRPERWLDFLNEVWPNDPDCIDALQEWFGYTLTPDTSQQKIAMIVGPRRSGKGSIGRVQTALLGKANVCGPTLGNLATNFGLWPLVGKSLAIIADARLSGRTDAAIVTERLLSISGEDTQTIDRKHQQPVTVKLPTRFMLMTNELPRLSDASGALAGRFIILPMTKSFYGVEDHHLTDKLLEELPLILHWAIEGLARLRKRGRFVQPKCAADTMQDMEDLASPVGAFVRDECVVLPTAMVFAADLYANYAAWCKDHGRQPAVEQLFGRDLRAAVPTMVKERLRSGAARVNTYRGIGLRANESAT